MMKNIILKKIKFVIFAVLLLFRFESYSKSLDFGILGVTLHTQPLFGQEITSENINLYPWKMDKRAIWIFTPGLLLTYDTRSNSRKSGFSLLYDIFAVASCYGGLGGGFGVGLRYRAFFCQNWYFTFDWYLNAMIYTRKFQETHLLDTKHAFFTGQAASLGYMLMHDIPDTDLKFILPIPVFFCLNFGYMFRNEMNVSAGISIAAIQIVSDVTFSIPIKCNRNTTL